MRILKIFFFAFTPKGMYSFIDMYIRLLVPNYRNYYGLTYAIS